MNHPLTPKPSRHEGGMALLAVLVLLLIIGGSAASFIGFMHQLQTRAGLRYRAAAALGLAEAGVHRALLALETTAPDGGPGRVWRPTKHSEVVTRGGLEGRFTISLIDDHDGAVVVTSVGEVAGITRRLRARVFLASPALLAGLYTPSLVRFEKPQVETVISPYGMGMSGRPWVHLAAGHGVWFETSAAASIHEPAATISAPPGPTDSLTGAIGPAAHPNNPDPIRLLLGREAELLLGHDQQRVAVQQLRAVGIHFAQDVRRAEAFPEPPDVDRSYFQALASANSANAGFNKTVGAYFNNGDLIQKLDSLYSPAQFEKLQAYVRVTGGALRLQGVIFVTGRMGLTDPLRLEIAEGALITEGMVILGARSSVDISHSASTRALPGLIVLGDGALIVDREARLRVHGLVYTSRVFEIREGARVDVVGAVLGADRGLGFRSSGAKVVIRYDPAVLGTPGLRTPDNSPVVAWVASWEELP